MAGGVGFKFYRNYSENDSTFTEPSGISSFPPITNVNGLDWSRVGYVFKGWNAFQNGSGTMHQSGDFEGVLESTTFYAIWELEESHDIKITYKGSTITTMDASGTKTLETSGKYCEDDITVEYTKSGGTEMVDVECSRATDYYLPDSATQNGNIITLPKDSCFAVHIYGFVDVSNIQTTGTVEVILLGSMFRDFYFFVKPGASGGSVTFS